MAKLLHGLMAAAVAIVATPAAAGDSWSAFDQGRRYDDRPYIYFVPADWARSGRFVSWDDGYFEQGGGIEVRNGQAHFDYDRDYPYEYRSYSRPAEPLAEARREPSCTIEQVRDRNKRSAEVRVCRN